MDRLSAQDASFLYMETLETPMHVGSLTLFGRTQVPGPANFASFLKHIEARLDTLPSYRRRLRAAPLGIDHPVWVREPDVDLCHHVQHRSLAGSGTIDQLRVLVASLHQLPLDRSRPLWQFHFIDGLLDGRFAVYMKIHHAAMDGVTSLLALPMIFDFPPDPGSLAALPKPLPQAADSTAWEPGLAGALDGVLQQNIRVAQAIPKLLALIPLPVGRP